MNSLLHRSYESNSPVRFYQFTNRIEIQNPGTLYGEARPENFPRQTSYRNPILAEAMKTIAFFNNKGGVGKTSLVYHLSWMMAGRGVSVLAVDLDPQANLSAMFLSEARLEEIWPDCEEHPATIYGAVRPIATLSCNTA